MPVARLGGGDSFAISCMVLGLSCRFSNLVSIFQFKGNVYMYIHFLNHNLFENRCMHILLVLALLRD